SSWNQCPAQLAIGNGESNAITRSLRHHFRSRAGKITKLVTPIEPPRQSHRVQSAAIQDASQRLGPQVDSSCWREISGMLHGMHSVESKPDGHETTQNAFFLDPLVTEAPRSPDFGAPSLLSFRTVRPVRLRARNEFNLRDPGWMSHVP